MIGAGGLMVSTSVADPVPVTLLALIETLNTPLEMGVPEMAPVEVSIVSPAGNPTALKLVGVLVAAML